MLNLSKNRKDLNLRVSFYDPKQQTQYNNEIQEQLEKIEEIHNHSKKDKQNDSKLKNIEQSKNKFLPIYIQSTVREQPLEQIKDVQISSLKQPQWYSWYILVGSLLCSGCIGPFFLIISIDDNELVLPAVWRHIIISLLIIPATFYDYNQKIKKDEALLYTKNIIFAKQFIISLLICGFLHSIWIGSLAYCVHFTNMANAYFFNNMLMTFFIIFKLFQNLQSTLKEKLGILVVFIGAALIFGDSANMYADIVAICGAFSASLYQLKFRQLQYNYPWMVGILFISIFSCIFLIIYCLVFEGVAFDFNPQNGLFGVFSSEWFVKHIWIALVTGIFNLIASSHMNDVFEPLLIELVHILEPIISQFIISLMQVQNLPGKMTWIGLFIALLGQGMITIGKQESDIEEILMPDYGIFDQKKERLSITSDTMANYVEMTTFFKQGILQQANNNNINEDIETKK